MATGGEKTVGYSLVNVGTLTLEKTKTPTAELSCKEYIAKIGEMTEDAQTYLANFGAHRPGICREEMVDHYTKWAKTYDKDLDNNGLYHGPKIAADVVAEEFPVGRDSVKILEIGAGTGNFGKEAHKHGFRELHGIDPSAGMLERCQEKNIYKKLLCDFFERHTPGLENDEYDCAIVVGAMGEGHLSCDCLYEMIRVVKPGGLVVIVMRKEYLDYVEEYRDHLEPLMDQLEAERKWQKISRQIVPNYAFNKEGVPYKVMPFWMKGSPSTFQRLLNMITSGLENCDAYIDDVIIYKDTVFAPIVVTQEKVNWWPNLLMFLYVWNLMWVFH